MARKNIFPQLPAYMGTLGLEPLRGIVARASKSGIGGRAGRKRIYQSGLKETKTGGRHEGIYMPAMPRREVQGASPAIKSVLPGVLPLRKGGKGQAGGTGEAQMMTVLDLFSGIGGFSLGLERTGGFKTVAFCEIDPFCQKVLAKHWPGVPIHDDVRTMPRADADVITAGFPCQDISNAGGKAGIDGERSGLWAEVARIVGDIRPKYLLLENVAALLNRGLGRVLGDLAEIGYDAEWHCIPASAVGAPHQRDRIWIVAYPQRDGQPRPRLNIRPEHSEEDAYREANRLIHAVQGGAVPFVCGGHDGVSSGVAGDRLRALGNAVVPQIPEMIGAAILRAEAEA